MTGPGTLVGVDVGGTFTDVVVFSDGVIRTSKVPTDVADQSNGFLAGLAAAGAEPAGIQAIVHGTTVATNAVIERKGARVGLITTAGFRDILELRRRDRHSIYGLTGTFEPLVPRNLRLEVPERVAADGSVVTPLDLADVLEAGACLAEAGVDAIAVVFLHSYLNPEHEQAAAAALSERWPSLTVVRSSEIVPVYGEFERTSTTSISAYVQPLVARYLDRLGVALAESGHQRELLVVQSNGGVAGAAVAARMAANTVLSGPAAGVVAAQQIGHAAGFTNVITADMGGTSLDISVTVRGELRLKEQTTLDFGMPLALPMLDIGTIGAGGGSIARVGDDGILAVGPESAGARPGPACYGHGGTAPTITDANLILGRLGEGSPLGSEESVRLHLDLATEAVGRQIAEPLGLSIPEAARAIIEVANLNMAGAIRLQSIERGLDPREFALVPFGGAGPLHAAALVDELGMRAAVVPLFPGITSAFGCIMSDFRHDFTETVNLPLGELDETAVAEVLDRQRRVGLALVADEVGAQATVTALHGATLLYDGQTYDIRIALPGDRPTAEDFRKAFDAAYLNRFGYTLDNPVRIMNLTTTVIAARPALDLPAIATAMLPTEGKPQPAHHRELYLREGPCSVPVYSRFAIPLGSTVTGPAIVEQSDSTLFLDEGQQARVDHLGSLIVTAN
ncbi:hydantoinase/oxoprolinase family protein [Nocardia sp. NPDC059239]|uniref:hydantoinase/oxoprolinase family protein n=1 Tax=Nocardia sp. NPDC059239 TaxID=3346785 RepID=UPI0036BC4490